MASDLRLNIGGVIISIHGDLFDGDLRSLKAYNAFITPHKDKPDILIRLHKRRLEHPGGEKAFDCPPIWALYQNGQDRVIDLFPEMPELRRSLALSPHGKEADLYLNENAQAFADAFYGPTLELLMVNLFALGKGAVIHACGIVRKETGILFVGESGAGKSTLARLLSKRKGVDVLSDDRIILRKGQRAFWIHGTPWHGDGAFASHLAAKLDRVFFLKHGSTNSITKVEGIDPPSRLLTCSFPPYWDPKGMDFTLKLFAKLTAKVPCYELSFRPDESIVEIIQTVLVN
jgi:hypothetical protein